MDKAYMILIESYLLEKGLLHDFNKEMHKVSQSDENHANVIKAAEELVEYTNETLGM